MRKMGGLEINIGEERMRELAEKGDATLCAFGGEADYLAQIGDLTYVRREPVRAGEMPFYELLNPAKHIMEAKKNDTANTADIHSA